MYISIAIIQQFCIALGVCILVSALIWLWLLLFAGKIEDKQRADMIKSRHRETPVVDIDEYLQIDQTYEWENGIKETHVN